jgi:hypothetical protein
MMRGGRRLIVNVPVAVALAVTVAAGQAGQANGALSREDAARLRQKVAAIIERGSAPKPSAASTVVTERELNAYLAYDSAADIPAGIAHPKLVIHGDRRVSATAIVDLDAVRAQRKSRSLLDPMNYVSGQLPVAAAGLLEARDGLARFTFESASVSGVPIPKMVLEEVVGYYTRSPEFPQGIDIDDPFPLPARIRHIDVRRGEALVVQ